MKDLKKAFDRVGVELMVVYDDTRLWEFTGLPLPAWEIPEQVRLRLYASSDASNKYDYCVLPDSYSKVIANLSGPYSETGFPPFHA